MIRILTLCLLLAVPGRAEELTVWSGRTSEFVAQQSLRAALLRDSFSALDRRE